MKSSPLKHGAAEGAEDRAGRDLAVIDGEAGHPRIGIDPRKVGQAHGSMAPIALNEGQDLRHIGVAARRRA